jgi:phospholipid/cholesterol/gamma-HCH transport system substrate-binding protein
VLIGACFILLRNEGSRRVSAVFPRTVSLFEGSDVRILGIKVGKVAKITPTGTAVRVDMEYDRAYSLPPDVKAVVISPSVIGDRFVQLTPAHESGATLAEGTVIGLSDTRVPVELDRTFSATEQLLKALGPNGVNKNGALSDFLEVGAETLDGQGSSLRTTIRDLATATGTLSKGSDDAFGTVDHLSKVTTTLADYDTDVEEFNQRLSSVAGTLASESGEISALLKSLATSLGEVESFVRDNREAVSTNVSSLATVTAALVAERKALVQIVDLAPLGFTNLVETYDPNSAAVRTRANFTEILRALDKTACEVLRKQGGDNIKEACKALSGIFDTLPLRDGLGAGSSASQPPSGSRVKQPPPVLPSLNGGLAGTSGGGPQ